MRFLLSALLVTCILPAFAADTKPPVIDLWPGVAPGEKGNIPAEAFEPERPNEKPPVARLGNISKPTLTVYKPVKDANGTAVIVAPGGGYNILAWEHEGTQVCEWLNSLGVTGVLLKYRVPRRLDQPKDQPPVSALQDAQRAVGVTRSKAKEWGIDDKKIGMLGFSAGGHLTAWTFSTTEKRAYDPIDDADKLSSRPDFAVLIYPGGLTDREKKLKPEIKVTKDTPPCFLAVSYNDDGPFTASVELTKALKENKVSAELHVYSTGGHGYGMKASDKPYAGWPARCGEWMKEQGYLKK
jgi:acetyl esterase/lipase